jgi:hypothetical protein
VDGSLASLFRCGINASRNLYLQPIASTPHPQLATLLRAVQTLGDDALFGMTENDGLLGEAASGGRDSDDRPIRNREDHTLSYDPDGNGQRAAVVVVLIDPRGERFHQLTAEMIEII